MHQPWRRIEHSIADKLFQFRFLQQFAALFYKNGESAQRRCCRLGDRAVTCRTKAWQQQAVTEV